MSPSTGSGLNASGKGQKVVGVPEHHRVPHSGPDVGDEVADAFYVSFLARLTVWRGFPEEGLLRL